MKLSRRALLAGAAGASAVIAAPSIVRAQGKTLKIGSLRLIHSITPHFYEQFAMAGTKIEVVAFDSPTDCKNAVVTRSVDFGLCGVAAAILGGAAGEPVSVIAAACNGGMAGVAQKDGGNAPGEGFQGPKGGDLAGFAAGGVLHGGPGVGGMA